MTPRDPFEIWKTERRNGPVPEGFADRVMNAVHATQRRSHLRRAASDHRSAPGALSILTLAAGVLVVAAGHAALVGGILLALPGTAN
jgi:hypothetical protein